MATNQFGQSYSGNDDYRGYLQANGYGYYLPYVGNDGGFNQNKYAGDTATQAAGLGLTGSGSLGLIDPNKNAELYRNWANARGGNEPGGAAVVGDAATAGYYDDQVRNLEGQIGRLDSQQNIGLENIGNSYNQGVNRLNEQAAVAERDYGTNKDKNVTNYLGTRNGIMQNTRATANSLQRLLGLGGSGYSSAALEQAPYAAALQGSTQLSGAQKTYGDNEASLATAWGDTQRGIKNARDDLDTQKYQQENSLRSSIAQTRASLLDQISQGKIQSGLARGQNYATAAAGRGGYQQQIDSLLDAITGYGRQYANPVIQAQDVKYTAPTQAEFKLDRFAAPTVNGGAGSDLSPTFLNLLATGKRDEYGNPIG